MDMGFHLVTTLAKRCGPKARQSRTARDGEPDSDSGYALKHSWL